MRTLALDIVVVYLFLSAVVASWCCVTQVIVRFTDPQDPENVLHERDPALVVVTKLALLWILIFVFWTHVVFQDLRELLDEEV